MTTRSNEASHVDERLGLLGRKVGMTRIFTDDGDADPRDGAGRVEQPRHPDQDAGHRRLRARAGRLRQAARLARQQGRGRPPRQGRRRSRHAAEGIPRRRQRRARELQGRRDGAASACSPSASWSTCRARRRARASPARSSATTSARIARRTATPLAQHAGLDLDGAGSGPRVPGQEDGGPVRQRHAHGAEPRHRPHRRERAGCCSSGAVPGAKAVTSSCARPSRPSRPARRPRGREPPDAAQAHRRTRPVDLEGRRARHAVRPRLQRSADPPDRRRLPGQRAAGTRAQKDRGEVKKSHKKPWRRRAPAARAPAGHRPAVARRRQDLPEQPDENFTQKVNRKMYRAGIASILSQLVREGRLSVVDSLTRRLAEDQGPRAEDQVDGLSTRCSSSPHSSTTT